MTETLCSVCNRPVAHPQTGGTHNGHGLIAAVYVVHSGYGCDTGCCGHIAYALDTRGDVVHQGEFQFEHPYDEDTESFARRLAHEAFPNIPVDIERCEVFGD